MWTGFRESRSGAGTIEYFGNGSAVRLSSPDTSSRATLYLEIRAYPGMTVTINWNARVTSGLGSPDAPFFALDYPSSANLIDEFEYTSEEWTPYSYSFTVPYDSHVDTHEDSHFINNVNRFIIPAFGVFTNQIGTLEITRPTVNISNGALSPSFRGFESTIVESGSNSDGEWTRWADGTQKCAYALLIPGGSGSYSDRVWSFPVPFTSSGNPSTTNNDGPFISVSVSTGVPGGTVEGWSSFGETLTQATLRVLRTNTTGTWTVGVAHGRWK